MMTHAEARKVVLKAWAAAHPGGIETPSILELQGIQSLCLHEGRYGDWKALNNWGAYQCTKHKPPCEEGHCVQSLDHHSDGTPYQACYRTFPTPEAGAQVVIEAVTTVRPHVWTALQLGDMRAVAWQMRYGKPLYYESNDVEGYAQALFKGAQEIASSLGEPLSVVLGEKLAPPPGPKVDPPKVQPKPPTTTTSDAGAVVAPLLGLSTLLAIGFIRSRRKR